MPFVSPNQQCQSSKGSTNTVPVLQIKDESTRFILATSHCPIALLLHQYGARIALVITALVCRLTDAQLQNGLIVLVVVDVVLPLLLLQLVWKSVL